MANDTTFARALPHTLRALLLLPLLAAAAGAAAGAPARPSVRLRERSPPAKVLEAAPDALAAGPALTPNATLACSALDPPLVVYNRIPKTGSTTLLRLMKEQQRRARAFEYVHSTAMGGYESTHARPFLRAAAGEPQRTLYDRHQLFLPGVGAGAAWVNVMREPAARVASLYYYMRYSAELSPARRRSALRKFGAQSLDECVARPRAEWRACGVWPNGQVLFFCGPRCKSWAPEGLALAKRNIAASYAVVGTLERLPETLELLERRLPGYFGGLVLGGAAGGAAGGPAAGGPAGAPAGERHANANPHPKPSAETLARIKEYSLGEYELYEFVNERMDRMLESCRG